MAQPKASGKPAAALPGINNSWPGICIHPRKSIRIFRGKAMSSISTSSYYQLPNQTTGSGNQGKTSHAGSTTLADLLSAVSPSRTTKTNNAGDQSYLLNLSDAAKSYLATLQNSATSTSGSSSSDTFLLSPKQREALNTIISKYKDKPITQANYNDLQKDLDAAGLGPKQLAVRDQLNNLNPTRFFLDALNGSDTSNGQQQQPFGQLTDQQQKQSENYLQSILDQWKALSPVAGGETA